MSRTPAAQLARLKVTYSAWSFSREGGWLIAMPRAPKQHEVVVLMSPSAELLEGELLDHLGVSRRGRPIGG